MDVAVGANPISGMQRALFVADERVGFLAVVETDDVGFAEIGSCADFDPAVRIRPDGS